MLFIADCWSVYRFVSLCSLHTVVKSFAFACKPWKPHRARSIMTMLPGLIVLHRLKGIKLFWKVHPSDLATAATLFLHTWSRSIIADFVHKYGGHRAAATCLA